MNDKGQFFGYSTTTQDVTVFHIEGWWGNIWDRIVGCVSDRGNVKVKLTPPYNLTGAGYTETGVVWEGTPSGYIKTTKMDHFGRIPTGVGGSASTYLCDYFYMNANAVTVAFVGGSVDYGAICGAWYLGLSSAASRAAWSIGAALSCEQPSAS